MSANLSKGTTLIEASAGSGKTYTLCRIVLRLIVIENISIDRILAVTFTNAATAELQDRIRTLLDDCLKECSQENLSEPVLIDAENSLERSAIRQRIQFSIDAFDEAQISTIHGFCKRALDFIPLESGMPFDASFEQVEDDMIERLRNEYIISHIYDHSPLLAALGLGNISNIEKTLLNVGKQTATHPFADLRPQPVKGLLKSIQTAFDAAIDDLPQLKDLSVRLLPMLKKSSGLYKSLNNAKALESLNKMGTRRYPNKNDLQILGNLTRDSFSKAIAKKFENTEFPPILETFDTLVASIDALPQYFAHDYRTWLQSRLKELKELSGVISFDDLLHILNRSLNSEQSEAIQTDLGALYDAVLIDEFQDTDPVQYNILNTLFGQGNHFLYYIGDPKQAIYSFRGADIQTYFQATQSDAVHKETLSSNYRSTPEMVAGSNSFFTLAEESFILDAIEFEPAQSHKEKSAPQAPDAPSLPGLHFEIMPTEYTALSVGLQKEEQMDACRQDILSLISDNIQPQEIAILVNSRFEADIALNILSKAGIPCEIRSDRSIFLTPEMNTVCLLLSCLARPAQSSMQKALLGSALFDLNWESIESPNYTDTQERLSDFLYDWSKNWDQRLFSVNCHKLLKSFSSVEKLAQYPAYERAYTNFLQLAELVSEAQYESQLSPQGLVNWLQRRRDRNTSTEESWQTRLQSDSGKLQITTIFSSKGLEYGYVFLPFMGQMESFRESGLRVYHRPDSANGQIVIDLNSTDNSTADKLAKREALAERARLIYVALTRAVYQTRVYLTLPKVAKSLKSELKLPPILQLMLGLDIGKIDASSLYERIFAKLDQMQSTESSGIYWKMRTALDTALDQADTVLDAPKTDAKRHATQPFKARSFDLDRIPYGRRVSSFSALSNQVSSHAIEISDIESKDKDEAINIDSNQTVHEDSPEEDDTPSIHNFLKGAKTGDLLHAILENLDYTEPNSVYEWVNHFFEQHQFGYFEYKPIVTQQIEALIETPLENDSLPAFALKQIAPHQKIAELEFVYPVDDSFMARFIHVLETDSSHDFPPNWIEKLKNSQISDLQAMLRGFIDLIIEHQGKLFIVDWKSNYIGPNIGSYTPEALKEAMAHHDYFLQYCIYIVALKRFVHARQANSNFEDVFGGVFYIFLRGIQNGQQSGIYYHKPSVELIDALDAALSGTEGQSSI